MATTREENYLTLCLAALCCRFGDSKRNAPTVHSALASPKPGLRMLAESKGCNEMILACIKPQKGGKSHTQPQFRMHAKEHNNERS